MGPFRALGRSSDGRGLASTLRACVLLHVGTFLAVSVLPCVAASAPLPKDDQRCISELNKNFAKVAKAQGKEIEKCLKQAAKSALTETVEECITRVRSDPNAAPLPDLPKLSGAKQKAKAKATDRCGDIDLVFDPADADIANAAATDEEIALIRDMFGNDLNAAIKTEKDDSKCQRAAVKSVGKCRAAILKDFNKCKKQGLKEGTVRNAGQLKLKCLDAEPTDCGVINKAIDSKCSGQNMLFPGCPIDPNAPLEVCLEQFVRCHVCRALAVVDKLDPAGCEEFDDGIKNMSCQVESCGNGVCAGGLSSRSDGLHGVLDGVWEIRTS